MRHRWFWFLILSALPIAGATQTTALILDPRANHFDLSAHLQVLEVAPGADHDPTAIPDPDQPWRPAASSTLNFGFSQNSYWLRLALTNPADEPRHLLLDLHQPLLDYVNIYLKSGDKLRQQWQSGNRRPLSSRPLVYRAFGAPFTMEARESLTVYIHLRSHDGLYDVLPVYLSTYEAFFNQQSIQLFSHGFFYGAILILLVYNLVVGVGTRERLFFIYSVHLLFFVVWNLAFRGYLAIWPLATQPDWHNNIVNIAGAGVLASMAIFAHQFLDLGNRLPLIGRILMALSVLMAIPLIMALSGYYASVVMLLTPVIFLLMGLMLGAAIHQALKGQQAARIFLLGWAIFLLAAMGHFARLLGWIPAEWIDENLLNLGSLVQMLVFSLALSYRINELKRGRLKIQRRLIQREREHRQELQQEVDEKTRELRALAAHLEQDALTDALTGLLNRRSFESTLQQELDRQARSEQILGLAILDLDHFKRLNDVLGHPEGDRVLIEVARRIQQHWQRTTDHCFRLGGEEFGIIFHSNRDLVAMETNINAFSAAVKALPLTTSDRHDAPRQVSVSIGVALVTPGARTTAATVYQSADEALYHSKHRGRDCAHYVAITSQGAASTFSAGADQALALMREK